MEVIAHDDKGMQPPGKSTARLEQGLFEGLRGTFVREQVSAVVSAIYHVKTRTGEFDTGFASHRLNYGNCERPSIDVAPPDFVRSQHVTPSPLLHLLLKFAKP
jgi:hypothetical protein